MARRISAGVAAPLPLPFWLAGPDSWQFACVGSLGERRQSNGCRAIGRRSIARGAVLDPLGFRRHYNAKFQRQRLAEHFLGRHFQILAEVPPQPVLVEGVRNGDDQGLAAHAELRARAEPDIISFLADAIRQPANATPPWFLYRP